MPESLGRVQRSRQREDYSEQSDLILRMLPLALFQEAVYCSFNCSVCVLINQW